MKNKALKFNDSHLDNVLFQNTPPEIAVYPFKRSTSQRLRFTPFYVKLSTLVMDNPKLSIAERLSKVVVRIANDRPTEQQLFDFFKTSPIVVTNLVASEVLVKLEAWRTFFFKSMLDYVKRPVSQFQWEIANSIGIENLMVRPLAIEQQTWIAYASAHKRYDERRYYGELADSLKPWMNPELYQQVEKAKKNKRENVAYAEQQTSMLKGSFGISDADKKVFDQLENPEQKTTQQEDDELDIIT